MRIHANVPVLVLCAALAAAPAGAQRASDRPPDLARWATVLQAAYELGGQGSVLDTSPSFEEQRRMPAGRGISFAVGAEFRPVQDSEFSYRATIGRKYDFSFSDNYPMLVMRRWTLMLGASHRNPAGRRSTFGFVAHLSPQVDNGDSTIRRFETAIGPMLEIGGRIFAGRVTAMQYRDAAGNRYSAFSAGLSVTGLVCGILDRYDLPDKERC